MDANDKPGTPPGAPDEAASAEDAPRWRRWLYAGGFVVLLALLRACWS